MLITTHTVAKNIIPRSFRTNSAAFNIYETLIHSWLANDANNEAGSIKISTDIDERVLTCCVHRGQPL